MRNIIEINPKYSQFEEFVNSLAVNGVPPDAKLIYSGRNKVYTVVRNGLTLNIKAFHKPAWLNKYIYVSVRLSKAERSMRNAQRLLQMGFNTPKPVAYVECHRARALHESYYVSRQINARDIRNWVEIDNYSDMLEALAKELHRLHSAGVYHKDLSPGNILFTRDENDAYKFYFIDLNRMSFDVKNLDTLMQNFKSIYSDNADETAHLARLYAHAACLDPDKTEAAARRELDKYLQKKNLLRKLKKLLK